MANELKSNLPSKTGDKTTQYFNNIFRNNDGISTAVSETVISWFQQRTGSRDSALVLAQTLISTAESLNENPVEVINNLRSLNPDEISAVLSLYLNGSRIPTSLLGIKNPRKTMDYVKRSIIF